MVQTESIFRALADPTRRRILALLKKGSLSAGEIAVEFPISMASLSHHYGVLKAADLIRSVRRGQNIVYSLNTTVFEDAASALADIFRIEKPDGGIS